jgi:hypothetical protein
MILLTLMHSVTSRNAFRDKPACVCYIKQNRTDLNMNTVQVIACETKVQGEKNQIKANPYSRNIFRATEKHIT